MLVFYIYILETLFAKCILLTEIRFFSGIPNKNISSNKKNLNIFSSLTFYAQVLIIEEWTDSVASNMRATH